MNEIMTVTGSVMADKLGAALMHEHFLFGFCGFQGDKTLGPFREEEYMDICTHAINRAKAYGINTFVDATTNECGRNPGFLKELAIRTGVNIICSTGFYHESESAFAYWKFRSEFADIDEEIYEMMKAEMTTGIENTGIRAGVIKVASGEEMSLMEKKFFYAAARVSRELDKPIITHTQHGKQGPEQARLLIEQGVSPQRIAIGHMCGNRDVKYHEEVLKQGVFDAFDRWGLEGEIFQTPSDEERAILFAELVRRGWEDQLLISHDSVSIELGRPRKPHPSMKNAHIGNIGERVVFMLKNQGISDKQIKKILVDNPARLLG